MTDTRPTPEQIAERARRAGLYAAEQFLDRLETEGYVIVHPDDVPTRRGHLTHIAAAYNHGWNDCRRRFVEGDV